MLSVDQLLTPLTRDQVKAKLYELAASLGLSTTSWFAGAPTRTIIAILSEVYGAYLAPLIVTIAKSGFLDDAEDSWLTLIAAKVYNVARREATYASGEVTLNNAGGGVYAFEIAEAVFLNSTTGATYTNTEAISLAALQVGLVIDVRALVLGSTGNADAGQIDTIVSTMANVSVTNAGPLVGQDEESDPDLRQRCRDSLGALSPNGPAAAYRYVALTPEFNGGANINRVRVLPALGTNTVTIVLASPDGAPSGSDVTLVQAGFDKWATPDTVLAIAVAAAEQAYSATVNATVDAAAGLTDAQWRTLIKQTVVDYIRALPIGGIELTVGVGVIPYRSVIGAVERARESTGTIYYVLHASLAVETNIAIGSTTVATCDVGDITVNVTQTSLT